MIFTYRLPRSGIEEKDSKRRKQMLIYICEDQPESVLSGIYDAWADPMPNREIRLRMEYDGQQELFCEYRPAVSDREKAQKVARSVFSKLGSDVWKTVEAALLADEPDKAQAVFDFLRVAFLAGPGILRELGRPQVMRVCELERMVRNECHLLYGFVRFADTADGILVAQIEPRHRQIPLLAPHFAQRLNTERFILYDRRRREAAVYSPQTGWYLTEGEARGIEELIRESERDGYASLWKVFFDSIAVGQRANPRCQRTLLPLRFRPQMTEFRGQRTCSD